MKTSREKALAIKAQNGICNRCGCNSKSAPGHKLCEPHLKKILEGSKALYHKRRENGLCVKCQLPVEPGKHCCSTCLVSDRYKRRTKVKKYKEAGLCACSRPIENPQYKSCDTCHEARKKCSRTLKGLVLEAYGPVCKGCGETEPGVLQIDHINGDGSKHRKQLKEQSIGIYQWLKDNNWPAGFRTLCANCNWRAHRGIPLPNDLKLRPPEYEI